MLHALLQPVHALAWGNTTPHTPCDAAGSRPVSWTPAQFAEDHRKEGARVRLLLVPVIHLLAPADLARAAGRNETHLLTRHRIAAHRRRVTDVLMVTSTVRVLDGVHRHTTDLRPAVALDAVLVEGAARLQQRLVNAAAAGDDADRRASARVHKLLLPRGQTQA